MAQGLILVTGATGFVGSHVVDRLLAAGKKVRVTVRPTSDPRWLEGKPVERVLADLRVSATLREAVEGVTAVLHFGGEIKAPSERAFWKNNAAGTRSLAEAFAEAAPRDGSGLFLYCSSVAAGGPAPQIPRSPFPHVREEDPPRPVSAYGRSKLEGERGLAGLEARLRVVVFRPPAIYGPRDPEILGLFRILQRGWLPIPYRKDSTFSLIQVRDLAEATLLALEDGRARGLYYVSDGQAHSWQDVGRRAADVLGAKVRTIRTPMFLAAAAALAGEAVGLLTGRPPLVGSGKIRELRQPCWVCLPEKATRDFGFVPRVEVGPGIEETIRWYQDQSWLRDAR